MFMFNTTEIAESTARTNAARPVRQTEEVRRSTPVRGGARSVPVMLRTAFGPGFGTGDVLLRFNPQRASAPPEILEVMTPLQGLASPKFSRPYQMRDVQVASDRPVAIVELHHDTVSGRRFRVCSVYHEPVTQWAPLANPIAWTSDVSIQDRLQIFTGLAFRGPQQMITAVSDKLARILSNPGRQKRLLEHWQQWLRTH